MIWSFLTCQRVIIKWYHYHFIIKELRNTTIYTSLRWCVRQSKWHVRHVKVDELDNFTIIILIISQKGVQKLSLYFTGIRIPSTPFTSSKKIGIFFIIIFDEFERFCRLSFWPFEKYAFIILTRGPFVYISNYMSKLKTDWFRDFK